MRILLVAPIEGNGGIQSLIRNLIRDFDGSEYKITHIGTSHRRSTIERGCFLLRAIDGLLDLLDTYKKLSQTLKKQQFDVFHTTTSGSIGTVRDFFLGRLCKRYRLKTILHCHYGCIPQDYRKRGIMGYLLKLTMRMYDSVWVLDSKSVSCLNADLSMGNKAVLVPNPIRVPQSCNLGPKDYTKVVFLGNMYRTKGVLELVEAISKLEGVTLSIVGPDYNNSEKYIRDNYTELIDKRVRLYGMVSNEDAIKILEQVDILALPTYYPWEAFPVSILEAMSRGKMVISTNRAAIPDMLTDLDGRYCGYIIPEKSSQGIIDAIRWCQNHKDEADLMCYKAFEKVKNSYDTSTIYKMYKSLYDNLALIIE